MRSIEQLAAMPAAAIRNLMYLSGGAPGFERRLLEGYTRSQYEAMAEDYESGHCHPRNPEMARNCRKIAAAFGKEND